MLESDELDEPTARAICAGIYEVTLNFVVNVELVPPFTRTRWPAEVVEEPDNQNDARRRFAAYSRIVVSPDAHRAGEREPFEREDGWKCSLLFVSDEEFATFVEELSPLVTRGIYDHARVSKIQAASFKHFLFARVVVPEVLTKYELQMLGRPVDR